MEEVGDGRLPALGGCGNAAMLIVLRSVFSGLLGPRPNEADLKLGMSVVEGDWLELESDGRGETGIRSLEGEGDGTLEPCEGTGRLFLGFKVGNGAGGFVGRGRCGNAEADAISSEYPNGYVVDG